MTAPNGNKYVGEYQNDKYNGQGVFTWSDGSKYIGEFQDGNFSGRATDILADGRKLIGEFKDGKLDGQAIEYLPNGSVGRSGFWRSGEFLGASAASTVPAYTTPNIAKGSSIQLIKENGTFKVPVLINGIIPLHFTVDSGASDVSIPADVVMTLVRIGTITDSDFLNDQTYILADGSKVKSKTFRIRQLKVGDSIVENVLGSIADINGSLLLGQSFLSRFKSVKFDYSQGLLVLEW